LWRLAKMAEDDGAPFAWKLGIGYAILVAVNWASSAGKFGADNAKISNLYPTRITPAGFTFAIWGPIFLLQGAGTYVMARGVVPSQVVEAVAPCWLGTWAAECAWQFVFCQLPLNPTAAPASQKLKLLVPAAGLLLAAQAGMVAAALRLRSSVDEAHSTLLRSILVDFPTGLNAGWLGAASGIGLSLLFQQIPALSAFTTPKGSGLLVAGVASAGMVATLTLGSGHTPGVGLGFAGATSWACYGISKSDTAPPEVKQVARGFMKASAFCALASLLWKRLNESTKP